MRLCSCELPHDRDSCRPYAEQFRIGVLDANTDRKSGGEMHPIEGSFDVRKSGDHASVFREHAMTNTLHQPGESFLGMSHEIHVDSGTNVDVFHLALPVVSDHIPGASVDEREHGSARSGVSAL